MSHERGSRARRTMGWVTLAGAACVLAFWITFLTHAAELGQQDELVRAFESAFPIADAVFCTVLFAASYCLLRGRPAGPFFLVAAGAMSLYLGILDTTFYGFQGLYFPVTGSALVELGVNAFCIGGGAAALGFGWRFWREGEVPGRLKAGSGGANPRGVKGRVVVVTGAARGIGAATARCLAEGGARLVMADIDRPALEAERAKLVDAGFDVVAVPVDVADAGSVGQLLNAALVSCGQIDVLVNCAGVIYPGPTEDAAPRDVRKQIDVNLLGTIQTSQAVLPYFRRRGAGHLIHIASLGGLVPLPGEATYAATKFAIRGFCLSLALELRDSPIRVSVVHPDSTETAQLRSEALHNGSPLSFTGQPLSPDDVARAIARTIERPRLEVTVPRLRGGIVRLIGSMPGLLARLYPLLDRQGRRGRDAYRRMLGRGNGTSERNQEVGEAVPETHLAAGSPGAKLVSGPRRCHPSPSAHASGVARVTLPPGRRTRSTFDRTPLGGFWQWSGTH